MDKEKGEGGGGGGGGGGLGIGGLKMKGLPLRGNYGEEEESWDQVL